jgi:hypothetical protein
MSKILLITRPRHDPTTHYLFYWAKIIIDLAKKKGFKILDLKKKRATKKEFTSIMPRKQSCFVFLNGHGDVDRVEGHDDEILVRVGENEELLEFKIVYALSCKSGKELGVASIEKGGEAYIGYDDDFIFWHDPDKTARPLADTTAGLFLEPSNYVATSLLKGHTVKDSCNRSKGLFMRNIHKLLTSRSSSEFVPYLLWDMRHQVCRGNEDAFLE